jgi:hypothetical protein
MGDFGKGSTRTTGMVQQRARLPMEAQFCLNLLMLVGAIVAMSAYISFLIFQQRISFRLLPTVRTINIRDIADTDTTALSLAV